jgi:hypothetical protein
LDILGRREIGKKKTQKALLYARKLLSTDVSYLHFTVWVLTNLDSLRDIADLTSRKVVAQAHPSDSQ